MTKNLKKLIIPLIIFLVSFFIYIFKLSQTFFYHPDFARDLHEILKISQGDLTLIGPKLTFGGLYSGPYYFYLFVPIFFLTKYSIASVFYFNTFLFSSALAYFCKKSLEKYGNLRGFLASFAIGLTPLYLTGARSPSNAYTFIPIFLFLLTLIFFGKKLNPLLLVFTGFIFGVIINFHYANILFLPAILIFLSINFKQNKNLKIRSFLFFFIGLILSFVPLIVFEIKHNFIMFTDTFIQKSYLKWLYNKNIPGGSTAEKNFIKNIFFLSKYMKSYILINPLVLIFFSGSLLIVLKFVKNQLKILAGAIITLILFSLVIRFQFIPHYVFGLSFFLFFSCLLIILEQKNIYFPGVIILFISLAIIYFPKDLYQPTWREPERFRKAVEFVIDNHLINKGESFNIIQITKENLLAVIGFEYRFFFRKYGYIADSEFFYSKSKKLIIFSEATDLKIDEFSSWEADQFGKKYFPLNKKYILNNLTIYKISK